MSNSDLSPADPQGGMEPLTDKTRVASTHRLVATNWVSSRTLQPSIESVVASSFVPSNFLLDGQVSGLGLCTPSQFILPWHMDSSSSCYVMLCFNVEEEVVIIRNGWTPRKRRRFRRSLSTLYVSLYIYNMCVCLCMCVLYILRRGLFQMYNLLSRR